MFILRVYNKKKKEEKEVIQQSIIINIYKLLFLL